MHEARDVQEYALAMIDAPGADERARLRELAAHVDPALRPRVEALAGAATDTAAPGPAVSVPGRQPPPAAPRLTEPLEPPQDIDELLDRIAVALERADDPDELELVLDGISRLRAEPVDPGRARALLERTTKLAMVVGADDVDWDGMVGFGHARDALAAVLLRWLGERAVAELWTTGQSPREAIAQRVRELADELPAGRRARC